MNDVKDFRTVRVTFRKLGRARYISHLDVNRTMTRALRRAGLPVWYTEGFNRHPYLTFASPLSLGFEGERETMDIRLEGEMPLDETGKTLKCRYAGGFGNRVCGMGGEKGGGGGICPIPHFVRLCGKCGTGVVRTGYGPRAETKQEKRMENDRPKTGTCCLGCHGYRNARGVRNCTYAAVQQHGNGQPRPDCLGAWRGLRCQPHTTVGGIG